MNATTAATASLASTSRSNSGWIPTIVEAKATLPCAASSVKFADNSDSAVTVAPTRSSPNCSRARRASPIQGLRMYDGRVDTATRAPRSSSLADSILAGRDGGWEFLDPSGNTIEHVATARVPAGTTIYEGSAADQPLAGGGRLLGGGSQVYILNVDPSWVTP